MTPTEKLIESIHRDLKPPSPRGKKQRRSEMKWVSVEDRLPEKNDIYLAFTEDREWFQARYWGSLKTWKFCVYGTRIPVTHWMPITSPPTEEDDGRIDP